MFEIALPFRGDAFRVIYAVQLADEVRVVHAFRKKAVRGIRTPRREIDVVMKSEKLEVVRGSGNVFRDFGG